jgi:predicted S18 family serine protease
MHEQFGDLRPMRLVGRNGEIQLDGTVTRVGGVKQKTIGARRTNVDVLLVPAGENAEEARRNAEGMRIIAVENFQQALRRLERKRALKGQQRVEQHPGCSLSSSRYFCSMPITSLSNGAVKKSAYSN